MEKLIHKDLTYKIIGIAYEVDNVIGFGQSEKVYADAFAELLAQNKIEFQREFYAPIALNGKVIAKRYYDFLIEDKVILEIKSGTSQYRQVCTQLFRYLKSSGLKLGVVARFTKIGVQIKRIPNLN